MLRKKRKKQIPQKKNNYYGSRILDFIFKKIDVIHPVTPLKYMNISTALKYFIINKQLKPYQYKLFLRRNSLRIKKYSVLRVAFFKEMYFRRKKYSKNVYSVNNMFHHKTFINYKLFFEQNNVPLVGKSPSLFYGDLKPIKYWKIVQTLADKNMLKTKITLMKRFPVFKNKHERDFFRQKHKFKYRFTKKYNLKSSLMQLLDLKNVTLKSKPSIKRATTPLNIIRSKTSNPLMFTNNININKLLKPQIDLTLKRFLKKNTNRRLRRFSKIVFTRYKFKRKFLKTKHKLNTRTKKIYSLVLKAILKKYKHVSYISTIKFTIPFKKAIKPLLFKPKTTTTKHRLNVKPIKYFRKKIRSVNRTYNSIYQDINLPNLNHCEILTGLIARFKELLLSKIAPSTPKARTLLNFDNTHCSLTPRTSKNFIFKNVGMFLNHHTMSFQSKPFTYKYFFKKKIFSFLYPNEVRNSLMNRKKKIIFYKLVYKINHQAKKKIFYTVSSFNKFFLKHYRLHLHNQSSSNEFSRLDTLFNPRQTHYPNKYNLNYLNYISSVDEILYEENFQHRGTDLSFRFSEVKIPRIRFRPGYQRMWRNARLALQELMNLKFIYQQQLTKYLVKFYKSSNDYNFSKTEMSLNRIIMYSRLLPDNPTVNLFFEQKLIYLNGRTVSNITTVLQTNDLVQLIVSIWYYVAFRWISNWTLKRHKKFKKLVYRKGLASRHKVMKLKKQKSYYTPNWIYLARYDISDVKPYLEVDYFTLSTFVIYEPFLTYYYAPDEFPDYRPNIYRMYNWKYIT